MGFTIICTINYIIVKKIYFLGPPVFHQIVHIFTILHLDLDHTEFTIQVLKLQDLPDEEVSITVSHLCVCDMDHFMVNIEVQLQQLTYEMYKFAQNV
jgi:hypothetical protein